MTGMTTPEAGIRRHGLYYPYFHVRDERWLKVAALYWPKIVRIVPDGYRTRDSDAVRALSGDLIVRRPPGSSVDAVAPLFLDLLSNHADELRSHYPLPRSPSQSLSVGGNSAPNDGSRRAAIHESEMNSAVQRAFVDAGLADRHHWPGAPQQGRSINSIDGLPVDDWAGWVVMDAGLVAVYSSVLAEDFARANALQPTTDQEDAYAVTNDWTADSIAVALLGGADQAGSTAPDELPEALAFLALDLVVPADLGDVPIDRIIEIREHHGAEFLAFGHAVDQAAAAMADLAGVRDQAVLDLYLRDVVTTRFAQPLEDLRRTLKELTGDAAMMSINVKTQVPAGAALAGGAWLAGHPLLAGAGAVAIGLTAVRRGIRQERDTARQAAPAASYLLHTSDRMKPRGLLERNLHRLAKIGGGQTRQ